MAELYSWVVSCANRVDVYLQNGQVVTDRYKLRVPGTNSLFQVQTQWFQVQIKGGGGDLFFGNKNLQPLDLWTGCEVGVDGERGGVGRGHLCKQDLGSKITRTATKQKLSVD